MSFQYAKIGNLDVGDINGVPFSEIAPTLVTLNLTDSFNSDSIGTATMWYSKTGNTVTLALQDFTTDALTHTSSYIQTDFAIPTDIKPIQTITSGVQQLIIPITFSYPMATNSLNLCGISIPPSSINSGKLVIYGPLASGGFNTATTVTIFSTAVSYTA